MSTITIDITAENKAEGIYYNNGACFNELDPKDFPKHADMLIKECLEKHPTATITDIRYHLIENYEV